jgi:hypothetical protein
MSELTENYSFHVVHFYKLKQLSKKNRGREGVVYTNLFI